MRIPTKACLCWHWVVIRCKKQLFLTKDLGWCVHQKCSLLSPTWFFLKTFPGITVMAWHNPKLPASQPNRMTRSGFLTKDSVIDVTKFSSASGPSACSVQALNVMSQDVHSTSWWGYDRRLRLHTPSHFEPWGCTIHCYWCSGLLLPGSLPPRCG